MDAPQPPQPSKETIANSIYPNPDAPKPIASAPTAAKVQQATYQQASSAFEESLTLVLGVASSTSYLLITYFIKNVWATVIISALLAAAAIFFAIKNYRRTGMVSPMTVIGLAAATITMVSIANILLAQAIIRSATRLPY